MKKFIPNINTRIGLIIYLVFFIWLKTLFAYFFTFQSIHSATFADYAIMILNPIGFTAIFFSLALFIKRTPLFYTAVAILSLAGTLLVYANVVYYREFSDFLSVNIITSGAGTLTGKGFSYSAIPIYWSDIFFWIDLIVILVLFLFKVFKVDHKGVTKVRAFTVFSISLMIFGVNFWLGDMTEHRLVSRQAQYDDTYVVRYLGLGPWLLTNGYYTHQANEDRKNATPLDLTKVQNYIAHNRYLAPTVQMEGIAKGKNLIVIHLESFQQDLINKEINGQYVTPFLNSLYNNNKSVYSFSNFFSEVGLGKTTDAETMLETSTFGLQTGNIFSQYGSTQTFQAMPAILNQTEGYSSAVFHGNYGSFYNRINTYASMGYQNFFDNAFWGDTKNLEPQATGWGIKDKYLFADSIQYLQQLQQPFYVKYLTVTNHEDFTGLNPDELDPNFHTTNSGQPLVDNYFLTAHYLDEAVQEFFTYLKSVPNLYNNSVIVLYGDHFGISNSVDSVSKAYAPYYNNAVSNANSIESVQPSSSSSSSSSSSNSSTSASSSTDPIQMAENNWNDYDNTMMQRVPLMIVVPGATNGGINNEYCGEIDVMPTLEHLLGVNTSNYIQFGQDLFNPSRQQFVAFRNRGFVTAEYTKPSGTSSVIYDTKTGQPMTLTTAQQTEVNTIQNQVNTMLDMSDALNTEDLLRFYTPPGFTKIQPSNYTYSVNATKSRLKNQQAELGVKSTSIIAKNGGKSTVDLFPYAEANEPGLVAPSLPSSSSVALPSTTTSSTTSGSVTVSSSSSSSSSKKETK